MSLKHTHKLRRHKYKTGAEIYFCTLPDCHFKIEAALALGKSCICNLCGDEFIMSERMTKLVRPHCHNCSKVKVKGNDGKNRYVRRNNVPVLSSIAESNVDNLRSRLDSVTTIPEDDI